MEKRIISKENIDDKNIFLKLYESVLRSKKLKPLDKLIYTLIRNRLNLSIENEIKNEDGNYYIYYSQEDIADSVDCSTKSVINSFDRLRKNNYIKTEKQKNGALKIFFYEIECNQYEKQESKNIEKQNKQSYKYNDKKIQEKNSQSSENFSDASENFSYNKDNKNNNKNNNNNNHIYIDNDLLDDELNNISNNYENELNLLKNQINYDDLIQLNPYSKNIIDELLCICMDMLTSKYTYINKIKKPFSVIKSVLKRLEYKHIEEIIYKLRSINSKINNMQGYIKTMLYNACISSDLSLSNQVNYDKYASYKF